ncbi:lysozyme inhibitor LprI family protein [Pseudoalteromonas sp. HL-AS1]|uniref:lysozyme inhibitor LprI family protein n=1 Tax=Pseudoalteromonas sp. HL-AS1 TaxID=3071081 RepID=UPI002816585F|nr:lysozyme inhibitor LprI family protein [Pseudoalteromonas sp. HL-AS1]WMS93012.1 lysozyme inhibitor LprI family protein [Pseudoalteromonas sp. HL-AS1]
MNITEKFGLVLLGVVISVIGYLFKRKIESKPQLETLDKQKKLLDIHKQMNEQRIDINGLKQLEAMITGKSEAILTKNRALQAEASPLIEENESEDFTQLELNNRAAKRLEVAKEKMQRAIAGIDSRVGDFVSQSLMNSQTEWESYSISQAEAASARYQGGSIYPFIYASELESLTNERTARLQAELDELIGRCNYS